MTPLARQMVSPLLPVLAPIVVAAFAAGVLIAWLVPPTVEGGATPAVKFTDLSSTAGLDFMQHTGNANDESPTTLGGGVAVIDYNGDGAPDLFFVNGAPWPWEESLAKQGFRGGCALFRNDGAEHFTDVSSAAGLNVELQGMAASVGDFDNDGLPDIFVTCIGPDHLFRNRGGGRFEDVTEDAGVGGDENTWSTGSAWVDIDGDGKLDLVVCHYARWPQDVGLAASFSIAAVGRSYGAPTGFLGAAPSVYHNLGGGKFALIPGAAGLRNIDPQTGLPVAKTLAVIPIDANGDGRLDLLFTYHTSRDALFLNRGDGTFARVVGAGEERHEGGAAGLLPASALPFATLAGNDQRFAALRAMVARAHPQDGDEKFVDATGKLGIAAFDIDLNGRPEVFSSGAVLEPDLDRFEAGRPGEHAPAVLWNFGGVWRELAAPKGNATWARPLVGRGVAVADFDGDGSFDVVISQWGAAPVYLHNDVRRDLPWMQIDLVASHGVREADGARVEVHTPRRVLVQTMAPMMGLMAQSSSTLLFGLGDDARVRKIVVLWPDGTRQEVRAPEINRRLVIEEK